MQKEGNKFSDGCAKYIYKTAEFMTRSKLDKQLSSLGIPEGESIMPSQLAERYTESQDCDAFVITEARKLLEKAGRLPEDEEGPFFGALYLRTLKESNYVVGGLISEPVVRLKVAETANGIYQLRKEYKYRGGVYRTIINEVEEFEKWEKESRKGEWDSETEEKLRPVIDVIMRASADITVGSKKMDDIVVVEEKPIHREKGELYYFDVKNLKLEVGHRLLTGKYKKTDEMGLSLKSAMIPDVISACARHVTGRTVHGIKMFLAACDKFGISEDLKKEN